MSSLHLFIIPGMLNIIRLVASWHLFFFLSVCLFEYFFICYFVFLLFTFDHFCYFAIYLFISFFSYKIFLNLMFPKLSLSRTLQIHLRNVTYSTVHNGIHYYHIISVHLSIDVMITVCRRFSICCSSCKTNFRQPLIRLSPEISFHPCVSC